MTARLTDEHARAVMLAAGLEPLEKYPGKDRPWKCRCLTCSRYIAPTYGNVRGGSGCIWCAGKRVDPNEAVDLMVAAGLQPLDPYPGANKPWKCRCLTCDHIVKPRYANVRNGSRCGWCAANMVDPDTATELMVSAGLKPLEPYPGSKNAWNCECTTCGRKSAPTYDTISGGGGCAWCAGKRVDPDEAAALMVSAGVRPLEPYPGSHRPWKCHCLACGNETSPTYSRIRQGIGGCGWCAGVRVDPDEAVALMVAAGLQPLGVYPGANVPWSCRCLDCGRNVEPSYGSIRKGSGCIWCAGKRVDPNEAVDLMVAAGLQPLDPYPGANKPWKCRCLTCDRHVTPMYSSVRNGAQCAWCAGMRVDPDEAAALMVAAGVRPLEPYPGALNRWRCECMNCGRQVAPRLNGVKNGQGGCRFCAQSGIDLTAPGVVYLLVNQDYFAVKIGITTTKARMRRVGQHLADGWTLVQTWDLLNGDIAQTVERSILRWWRNTLGAPIALSRAEMPQGGYSETASLVHVELQETIERIQAEVDAVLREYA